MDRNKQCWCDSKKKWKNCHNRRQYKKPLPIEAILAEFYNVADSSTVCLHPLAPKDCSDKLVRAHTVQRNRSLSSIAENNLVLSARNTPVTSKGRESFFPLSIKKASTFKGFCAQHDREMFRPIDNMQVIGPQEIFLLSYRALCFELFMKEVSVEVTHRLKENMDNGLDFAEQARIQRIIYDLYYFSSLGVFEHQNLKKVWDDDFRNSNFDELSYVLIEFDDVLPLLTSEVFFPEYDFSGKLVQKMKSETGSLDVIHFNIFVQGGRSYALFSCSRMRSAGNQFLDSVMDIDPDDLSSAIIRFCFDTSDNTFLRPSWWQHLQPERKSRLLKLLRESMPDEKVPDGLSQSINGLDPTKCMDIRHNIG